MRDPVDFLGQQLARVDFGLVTDDHHVALRLDINHVHRLGVREPQTAALAEGEESDAGVLAQDLALGREHEARLKGLRRYLLEILAIPAGRDKANLLALGLVGNGEAKGSRQ